MSTLVLIPCFNEEKTIADTINAVRKFVTKADICVIDNASTDSTSMIARNLGVKVIFEPQKGKGYAIRRGFEQLSKSHNCVFMLDGDNTYSTKEFKTGERFILQDGYDMIVGRRTFKNESSTSVPRFRRGHLLGNVLLTRLFNGLFGFRIDDTLSGWRIFSPQFVNSFTGGASGFEIETELNAHSFLIKSRSKSVPVEYYARPHGSVYKLRTYKDGLKFAKRLLSLFTSERPAIAFFLLSLPWFTGSLILLINVLENYFRINLVPNLPSFIASVGMFIVGVIHLTIGLVLENVRITRATVVRFQYRNFGASEFQNK